VSNTGRTNARELKVSFFSLRKIPLGKNTLRKGNKERSYRPVGGIMKKQEQGNQDQTNEMGRAK